MPYAKRGSLKIYYEDLGGPEDRTIVFLHGLLLSVEMMRPVAHAFDKEQFRIVLAELHGHGRSSRPTDASSYSMSTFAQDVIALADHLEQPRIGVFGTSLGADVALGAMLDYPERIAGAVLEMPVLEEGATVAKRMFRPVARGLRSRYAPRALKRLSRAVPNSRLLPGFADSIAQLAREPASGAAVIEGLLEEALSHRWDDVDHCQVPALVIAHAMDPLHAFKDAQNVARRLPNAEFMRAYNILELRVRPRRLVHASQRFFDDAFAGPKKARKKA